MWKVGDKVRLQAGGPEMKVSHIEDIALPSKMRAPGAPEKELRYRCVWWDATINDYKKFNFPGEVLEKV